MSWRPSQQQKAALRSLPFAKEVTNLNQTRTHSHLFKACYYQLSHLQDDYISDNIKALMEDHACLLQAKIPTEKPLTIQDDVQKHISSCTELQFIPSRS